MIDVLKEISIRGRLALGAIALQNAFRKEKIEGEEVSLLMDKIWEFTNSMMLDEWERMIDEIMPVCVLDPKETFDSFIFFKKEFALKMKRFYLGIPPYLIDMIDWTISIGTDNLYGGTEEFSPSSLKALLKLLDLCRENSIEVPPVSIFKEYFFTEEGGWGKPFMKKDVVGA